MFKPPVSIVATSPGSIATDTNYFYSSGTCLHFGGELDLSVSLVPIPGVQFSYNLGGSSFAASKFAFVRTGSVHRQAVFQGTNYVCDSTGLDTKYPFGTTQESDSPSTDDLSPATSGSVGDGFEEFLMFQDDANSIAVPLQSVTWNWSAQAVLIDDQLKTISPSGPNFHLNQNPSFPFWVTNIDVHHWTSHQS